jgi:hypothetical protein
MSGLMELGPMTGEITVMGEKLTLRPISTANLIVLFDKFPVLIELLEGKPLEDAVKIVGPLAVAHVIACSTGEMENPAAITVAMNLGVGKTAEAVEKIMEITFEDGTGPFVERIGKSSKDTMNLLNVVSVQESSVPWSASLTGDEPRPMRLKPRLASSRSG